MRNEKRVEAEILALAVLKKMVQYEATIDKKVEKTEAEKRHIDFLRAILRAGNDEVETEI